MAFLDNSGDIILDAVLTDVGRKRMAKGNFKIVKFALGDDEVDYGLYNKAHASGSAYYDLEILQTPVLEAFTQTNAAVNYGLVTYARNDLLYLPTIALNNKTTVYRCVKKHSTKNVIFLADNTKQGGSDGITTTGDLLKLDGVSSSEILVSGQTSTSDRVVLVETGINSTELDSGPTNQNTYLLSTGLVDNNFVVSVDKTLIASVLGMDGGSWTRGTGDPTLELQISSTGQSTTSSDLANYSNVVVKGETSRLYANSTDASALGSYSMIAGPRGGFTAMNFLTNPSLTATDFSKFGKRQTDLFSSGRLYDYIDTIVYVRGINTNIVLQVPVRVIQAAQSAS